MFRTLLIANRGEIACRIARTARRLGIETIAVYSEADAGALHVHAADRAYPIGPAPARESYLNIGRIIETARMAGAEAIHPGYGFLSENAEFAEACAAAGIVFVGPPASAMRAMGSKSAAKALMEKSGVPLLPGYHGDRQDADFLEDQAVRIGFPVVIKAVSGGGGRGMRVVTAAADFASALGSARQEAASAFGDDRVLVERICNGLGTSRFRCLPIPTATRCICSNATARRSAGIRRCWRKRRRRAVGSAARGDGVGRGRRCSRGRLCRCGNGGIRC